MTSPAKRDEPGVASTARLHIWQFQAARDLLLIAAVIGLVYAGYAMRTVTVPLLIALALAYLFEPLILRMTTRWRMSRPFAVTSLMATVGIAIIIMLAVMIPMLIGQTVQLVEQIRSGRFASSLTKLQTLAPADYQDEIKTALEWIGLETPPLGDATDPNQPSANGETSGLPSMGGQVALSEDEVRRIVREELAQSPPATGTAGQPTGAAALMDLARRGGAAVLGILGTAIQLTLLTFLIPFYFFFFSMAYPRVVKFGQSMIPNANRDRTLELLRKMDAAVAGFVRGRIVICFLVGVMLAGGWLLCGVPYAITIGMVIGAFFLVPYLGGVGLPLAIGLLWFGEVNQPEAQRMAWWAIILWPSLVFAIVQVIETYILTPIIAGKATNLDPVTILVAVLAGGSVGGVYGMLLAIPAAACAKILVTDVLLPRIKAWTQGKVSDPLPM